MLKIFFVTAVKLLIPAILCNSFKNKGLPIYLDGSGQWRSLWSFFSKTLLCPKGCPSSWQQHGGSLEEHDSQLPHHTSELCLFIINYAPYLFHRHNKETGMEVRCRSTLYYLVSIEAALGKSHGRSQAVTGSISLLPDSCWGSVVEVTHCTFCGFLLASGDRCPWPSQPWPAREISSTEGKAKRDGNTSVLRTEPTWGQREPTLTSVSSKIQLQVRDLHFAPPKNSCWNHDHATELLQALSWPGWLK